MQNEQKTHAPPSSSVKHPPENSDSVPNEQENLTPPQWVELPPEITIDILQRLGKIEIVENVQRVCSTWWKVCHDPSMWRVVHFDNHGENKKTARVLEKICRIAVDRSQGQLLNIIIRNFGNRDLLNYIAQRSTQLKHLRLWDCSTCLSGDLAATAYNFPLLEELHISSPSVSKDDIEIVGRSCPLLKSFIWRVTFHCDLTWTSAPSQSGNDYAQAIATSMPKLQHLSLFGNTLTHEGLQAIFDGCLHLESLDLRDCFLIDLEGDLGRRCRQQIVDLKYFHISEYEFCESDFSFSSDDIDDYACDYEYEEYL